MNKYYWIDKDPAGYASGHVIAENKKDAILKILNELGFKEGEVRYFWRDNKGIPILAEDSIKIELC